MPVASDRNKDNIPFIEIINKSNHRNIVQNNSTFSMFDVLFLLFRHSGRRNALDIVECYDFNESKWKSASHLGTARRNASAVVLEGVLYVIAGIGEDNVDLNSVEKYNFETEKWQLVASLSKCKGEKNVFFSII